MEKSNKKSPSTDQSTRTKIYKYLLLVYHKELEE